MKQEKAQTSGSTPVGKGDEKDGEWHAGEVTLRHLEARGAAETERMSTGELRASYLCEGLAVEDSISLVYWDVDRAVIGAALPVSKSLKLSAPGALRADYFCERREIGIVNLGGSGSVAVDGEAHPLGKYDFVYAGRGSREIVFEPGSGGERPVYYMVSYPAHRTCGTARIPYAEAEGRELGATEGCNERSLHPMIAPAKVESCQLVMGVTLIAGGSVWNTMPPHTHLRRSEIYFYFSIEEDSLVFHFMGRPSETRHLVVRDRQAVLSPSWSIHSGVGTANYGFVWAMGGENQEFSDMDGVDFSALR
ncbi:MAG: 5-dehydro-4-deoxy-D-glucuronate isomerase [Opitutales bacterium]|nr:5-dehydro-4-deoxy-D-glucuronate isomerase [Opitutales bacterium]